MTPNLTHLALHVRDPEACIAFYRDFCAMGVVHERDDGAGGRVVWLAEPGRDQGAGDYSHFGFAVDSAAAVDAIAARAEAAGCLVWSPRAEPYPVGYYCGLRDPDGNFVEFSFGQPLGPGAPDA